MFTILIVDDNKSDREGIRDLIDWDTLGIQIVGLASDGYEGYTKAIELKPDIILTDIAMPVMDGIKMTQKIKEHLPETKFLFMSCFDDFNYLKGAINLEVYGYILKPIDLSELTEALIKVKNIREAESQRTQKDELLKRQLQESIPILQERFMKDLLYGKLEDENDIKDRMKYLGMDFTYKYYVVLFLQIDNYDLLYTEMTTENKHLIVYRIQSYIKDTILKDISGYVTNQQNNTITIVLFMTEGSNEEMLSRIIDASSKLKEMVNESGTSITIGISEFSSNLKAMPHVYETAEYAVKSKFYSGGNRLILASEVKKLDNDIQYDIMEIKNRIQTIIEGGEEKDTLSFLNDYYNSNICYPVTYVKSLSFTTINIIQTILIERNQSFSNIICDDLIIWNKLLHFETLFDIRQWIFNIIETTRNFFSKDDNNRHQKIVEDIKAIISENYARIESVDQVVKPLFISTSHANYIFKLKTGQTIFDYLLIKRMEVAKAKLLNPYTKIYEIAGQVGYKTNSYFASVFKEYTGLTPKQFRDKHAQ